MGKHFNIDSEQLITCIKKHEEIWNKDVKEYHKKNLKELAWHSVCEEIYDDWGSVDDSDKERKLFMLKKRWNNIRDYFKKDLALQLNGSIGQPAMKRKKYMFSNKLQFLRPTFEKMLTGEKASDNEQEGDEYLCVSFSSDTEDSLPLQPKANTTSSAQMEVKTDSTDDESDMLFLKSLAPDMKALNRRQKIDFKLGILQLYKNIITPPQTQQTDDPLHDECEDKKFVI